MVDMAVTLYARPCSSDPVTRRFFGQAEHQFGAGIPRHGFGSSYPGQGSDFPKCGYQKLDGNVLEGIGIHSQERSASPREL